MPRLSNKTRTVSVTGGADVGITLEQIFWDGFCRIARGRGITYGALLMEIKSQAGSRTTLASAVRVFVYKHDCAKSAPWRRPNGGYPSQLDQQA